MCYKYTQYNYHVTQLGPETDHNGELNQQYTQKYVQ